MIYMYQCPKKKKKEKNRPDTNLQKQVDRQSGSHLPPELRSQGVLNVLYGKIKYVLEFVNFPIRISMRKIKILIYIIV